MDGSLGIQELKSSQMYHYIDGSKLEEHLKLNLINKIFCTHHFVLCFQIDKMQSKELHLKQNVHDLLSIFSSIHGMK